MMIECKGLTKYYDKVLALDGLDICIPEGVIYGLLGPNGAGKSTFINILAGLVRIDEGEVKIMDTPLPQGLWKIKKHMGFVPQDLAIYPDMTAFENVSFFASLYGLKGKEKKNKIKQVLDFVGLWDRRNDLSKNYSGGMKRRLNIACGICHQPQLIFLDEPTVGIDPQSRNHILEAIKQLNEMGNTVIYTTHYMEEAQSLCDEIAIIDLGKIKAKGTLEELQKTVTENEILYVVLKNPSHVEIGNLNKLDGVISSTLSDNILNIIHDDHPDYLENIVSYLSEIKAGIEKIENRKPNLEDVFLELTGKVLRD